VGAKADKPLGYLVRLAVTSAHSFHASVQLFQIILLSICSEIVRAHDDVSEFLIKFKFLISLEECRDYVRYIVLMLCSVEKKRARCCRDNVAIYFNGIHSHQICNLEFRKGTSNRTSNDYNSCISVSGTSNMCQFPATIYLEQLPHNIINRHHFRQIINTN
jgi:hypothetical protein